MTDFAASFGQWQMDRLETWYDKRLTIVNYYQKNLSEIDGLVCPYNIKSDEKHAYHLYIIRILPEKWTINRNQIIESLNNAGIGTSVHYKPVHMHSYYKNKYGIKNEDFSNSIILQ